MTISTSVHSNAFNFMSYIQSGVDPRTGQYTASITLPDVKTNGLRGPGVPLALSYNPLNTQDSGFGLGWNLQLSQFTLGTQIVSLSSGETFKVDGTRDDQLLMSEKKIDSFHFYKLDDSRYRVVHKSGLVEHLEVRGSVGNRVALPVRICAPEGHSVTLEYTTFSGHQMLREVKDDSGQTLLSVSRGTASVEIQLHAADGPGATFMMLLGGSDRRVTRIELPTENKASWRFEYTLIRNHLCMISVETPVGGQETVLYQDEGHQFPAKAGREPLPRVTHHRTAPGFGQPEINVHYSYKDSAGREHNFLGAGLDIAWEDNGLDNLYQYLGAEPYQYSSTETLRINDLDVRSIERVFSQFHLLVRETTRQNVNIMEVDTSYYVEEGQPFYAQPAYCQLPKEVKTSWRLSTVGSVPRTEVVSSRYDIYGNLLAQTQANGVVENSEWYLAEGEDGCPPDPEGFVRNLKSKTVVPAASEYGQAPTLISRYRYKALPAVTGSQQGAWLTEQSETLLQLDSSARHGLRRDAYHRIDSLSGMVPGVDHALMRALRDTIDALLREIPDVEQELQRTVYEHIEAPADAFQHGRVGRQIVTMGGQNTTTEYVYSTLDSPEFGESVQRTVQTVTGFDGTQQVITLEHSLLIGEPLLNRDDNNVEIRYVYDNLRRVVSETVAPGTEYAATRRYEYVLCANPGDQAEQRLFDVKDVRTCSRFDGLNRVIYEERDNADDPARADEPRQTYSAVHDAWGRLLHEAEYDWLETRQLALTSHYEYDDWGEQRCVTGPDGVRTVEETDPIGTAASKGPIQHSWTESSGSVPEKSAVSETWLSLFEEQPTRSVRLDSTGQVVSLSEYHYDGLGRRVREAVSSDAVQRITAYTYDAFDRPIATTLPSGAIEHRSYAAHSSEDLPTSISVEHNGKISELGQQAFDGLDRIVRSVTGGRTRTLSYDPGLLQPKTVNLPSGRRIDYKYQPQLGSEPLQRTQSDDVAKLSVTADYEYDPRNARLLNSLEQGEALKREYYSTGSLKSEQRTSQGNQYTMHYRYSRLGLLLSYTDVLGQEQTSRYDTVGRLEQTRLGDITSNFTYDAFGRTASIATADSTSHHKVVISLEYDDQGRERLRTFDLNGVGQRMVQMYNGVDEMIKRTLTEGGTLIRDETYRYDTSGRLVQYDCAGTQLPVDPYRKVITRQVFSFDGVNNLTTVMTTFEGKTNVARYFYEGADPAQLTRVQNSHTDYPTDILLDYDPDGNLTLDEEKRPLKYDPLGRLIEVGAPPAGIHLSYGPDDLVAGETRDGDQDQRFYRGGTLANTLGSHQNSTFMRGDGYLLAEHQSDQTVLLATSISDSVLSEVHAAGINRRSYTVYGYPGSEDPPVGSLGYNGELAEADTGWQLLGNGYRAYNPVLMRFNSPDSWSPFGEGGVNAYAYVEGDPVNGVDPTGHSIWGALLRLAAPLSSAADSSIPKALLGNSKGIPVRLRKMTPKTVENLRKRVIPKDRAYKNAQQNLTRKTEETLSARSKGKPPSSRLVTELSAAEEAVDNTEYLFFEAQRVYTYASQNVGKRIVTKEVKSTLKKFAKEFDINEAIASQQERIRLGQYQTKRTPRDFQKERSFLGDGNS
ncbi:sugar-binding protein [Pseudomonas syringae]|uniref:Sugar-binding protein n=1 Tax=Pseudomonas syringae TaxID=317 RepID=A0A244ESW2_PSESX|nr:RHS repeat-associated core domain-containing protein [Pseudomonas syringae]OUM07100.1 sugar-binding protein [Pseudomonas syringae]